MYGRAIRFVTNSINVQSSTVGFRVHPAFFLSTQPNYKKRNLVDDIRESASGLPPTPPSSDRVNAVKTTTTPPSSSTFDRGDYNNPFLDTSTTPTSSSATFNRRENNNNDDDSGSFVADTVKQGVVKAVETGLNIGEMAKSTLDNMYDVTKDAGHKVKEAVAGDEKKYDVPASDHFVDDLRKHADGYDLRRKRDQRNGPSGINDI
ncbi:uncharacterized protein LOC143550097 [Bidens hawaiensis]|uniref:uncharacterized protein LOC143550094 n=1 Tax=Bidens hawaiensis TaxID=980011 RepID=UPI0040497CF7